MIIRPCRKDEFPLILEIINEAAQAYKPVLPSDCWHEPYMPQRELAGELAAGVNFMGMEAGGRLVGVMGRQDVEDVTLIRHAYVRPDQQRRGVGGRLLASLLEDVRGRPVLVGTWAAATWAVAFYQRHGFRRVSPVEKDRLLARYWSVPDRQAALSVVLAAGRPAAQPVDE